MIKRHWLTVLYILISMTVGLFAVNPVFGGAYLYPWGIMGLLLLAVSLLTVSLISWRRLKLKRHTRDPRQSVLYQGAAFTAWFSGLNLFWTLLAGCCTLGLLIVFGPRSWVLVLCAGALTCAVFSLLGLLRMKKRQMMGLCWQSPVPFNLENLLDRTAATMILNERFEFAADHDQKQSTPLLWSLSRIFDRRETGGVFRKLDLMGRDFPKRKMKQEWWQRLKIMLLLFLSTSVLAALPGLLGLTSTPWDKVPDGWPSAKVRRVTEDKQSMAAKNLPEQPPPDQPGRKQEPQTKEPEKEAPKQETLDKKADTTPPNDNQEYKHTAAQQQDSQSSQGESEHTVPGDQKPAQEGQDGQKGGAAEQDSPEQNALKGEQAIEGDANDNGESGEQKQSGNEGEKDTVTESQKQDDAKKGKERKGKESSSDSETHGECNQPGEADQTGRGGKPGEGNGQTQGTENDKEGKGGGKHDRNGDGQQDGNGGTGKGKSQGKGKADESGQEGQQQESGGGKGANAGQKGGDSQTGGAQDGTEGTKGGGPGGEGQGKGSPDDIPEMDEVSQSQPLQKFPSRETELVNLELPTLVPTGTKGESKKDKKNNRDKITGAAAPASEFKTGTQDRRIKRPEQFLPNWILMLIKTTRSSKNSNTKGR